MPSELSNADLFADAIPHRPPMLLLDAVVSRNDTKIVCKKTFRGDEFFFQGHYPDHPVGPGVILCECAAQAGAVLLSASLSGDPGLPVLTRMNQVKFKRLVEPGQTIHVNVALDERVSDAFFFSGKLTCDERTVATLSFACKLLAADSQM